MVAFGDKLECSGRCVSLTLHIQNCVVKTNFYVLSIVACQVVLGVQWLQILGSIEIDNSKLTMAFNLGGKSHVLQGLT